MCGVAQEATHEDDIKAYTKPWHVTVTTGTVSFAHFTSVTKIMVGFFLNFRVLFLTHKHFHPCSLCPVLDPL